MTTPHDGDATMEATGLTRRQALKVGAATFVGYAVAVEKVEAQAIKTDTAGIEVGDYAVEDRRLQHAGLRGASRCRATNAPIIIAIGEVWGVHEWVKDVTRRFAKAGYCCVAPELFQREGGMAQRTDVQEIVKIVFAVPRKAAPGRRRRGRGLGEDAPGRAGRSDRRDRLVLGWRGGGPGSGDQPGHPGRGLVVRSHRPPLRRHTEPSERIRRGQGHQGPVPGLDGETDMNRTPADARKLVRC